MDGYSDGLLLSQWQGVSFPEQDFCPFAFHYIVSNVLFFSSKNSKGKLSLNKNLVRKKGE